MSTENAIVMKTTPAKRNERRKRSSTEKMTKAEMSALVRRSVNCSLMASLSS